MPRLDDLVRDAVDDLVESVPVNAVFAEVAARRTRRRRARRTAGAVLSATVVAVAAVALTTVWRDDDSTRVTFAGQPVETAPPETQPLPPEPNGGFALWPEDTAAEWTAAAEKPAWRFDAVQTAQQFAAEVLGWPDVQPELVMPEVYGRHYRIAREPGGPVVIVHMEERQVCAPDTSCSPAAWSVMAVNDDPMPCEDAMPDCFTMDVTVQDGAAHLRFGMLDAASADVELSSGTSVRATTTTGEVVLTLDHAPADPGYLLLLFRDAGGRVAHAYGYTLGPQDFAVG